MCYTQRQLSEKQRFTNKYKFQKSSHVTYNSNFQRDFSEKNILVRLGATSLLNALLIK